MQAIAASADVAEHVVRRLLDADIKREPYQHTYIENIFPLWFYDMLLAELPPDEVYTDRSYDNRAMVHLDRLGAFWKGMMQWMVKLPVLDLFEIDRTRRFSIDLRLVRDSTGYKIKPHTDIKSKCISMLFYLPEDDKHPELGTSIYVPKEKGFESDGTKRYEFEAFDKIYTAPYVRNSMFGFPRSNVSFHGVEPSTMTRNALLLNIYAR